MVFKNVTLNVASRTINGELQAARLCNMLQLHLAAQAHRQTEWTVWSRAEGHGGLRTLLERRTALSETPVKTFKKKKKTQKYLEDPFGIFKQKTSHGLSLHDIKRCGKQITNVNKLSSKRINYF